MLNAALLPFQSGPASYTHAQFPMVWERNFDKKLTEVGRFCKKFINFRRELKIELGVLFDVALAAIELSRRFGNGFHFSNEEFLQHMGHTVSLRKLVRDKGALSKLGLFHCRGGVKNRTHYYLHEVWFDSFVNRLFSKLGVLQRQNGASHIISNEELLDNDHMSLEKVEVEQNTHSSSSPKAPSITNVEKEMSSMGIYLPVARKLVVDHGEEKVVREMAYINGLRNIKNRGAYLNKILNNCHPLNCPTPPIHQESKIMEDPAKAQGLRHTVEEEAIRRLSLRGKNDPRLDFNNFKKDNCIDLCREYDEELFEEINKIRCIKMGVQR